MYKDIFLQSIDDGGRFYTEAPGTLWDRRGLSEPMMIDNEYERTTNQVFLDNAFGDVLIGGLGIGLIIKAIEDNANITSITVIEKHQRVIDLIVRQSNFNNKVTVIQGDIHTYIPTKQYETIWLDDWTSPEEDAAYRGSGIFVGDSREQWKHRFSRYLTDGGYINYWRQ